MSRIWQKYAKYAKYVSQKYAEYGIPTLLMLPASGWVHHPGLGCDQPVTSKKSCPWLLSWDSRTVAVCSQPTWTPPTWTCQWQKLKTFGTTQTRRIPTDPSLIQPSIQNLIFFEFFISIYISIGFTFQTILASFQYFYLANKI